MRKLVLTKIFSQSSKTLVVNHDEWVVVDKALKESEVFVFLVLQGICQMQVNFEIGLEWGLFVV